MWALGGLVAATAASVALSLSAWADAPDRADRGAPMAMQGEGHGPGMGEHHAGGLPFAGRHLDRLLDEAKATDAQRTQIKQISEKAQADLKALHEQGRALHEQALTLWAQPKLDAAAAEKLRQSMSSHHEQVSKRMTQAMLDVGNVLTPAQRATVAERMRQHQQGMLARMKERMQGHGPMGKDRGMGSGPGASAPDHQHPAEK